MVKSMFNIFKLLKKKFKPEVETEPVKYIMVYKKIQEMSKCFLVTDYMKMEKFIVTEDKVSEKIKEEK